MKQLITVALVLVILAANSMVVLGQEKDTSPNAMGLYFELEPNAHCLPLEVGSVQTMYVVLANASFPELHGFHFGFSYDVLPALLSGNTICPDLIGAPPGPHFYGVPSYCEAIATTPFMVLASYTIMTYSPVSFFLQGINEGEPLSRPLLNLGDDVYLEANVTGGVGGVSAQIGGLCEVVASEEKTWDSVKSLYR